MKLKFSPSKSIVTHSVQNATTHFIRSVSAMLAGILVQFTQAAATLRDGELLQLVLHHM